MRGCRRYKKWLVDDFLEALTGEQKRKLHEHLQGCSGCQTYFEELRSLFSRAHPEPRNSPAEEFWSHLWEKTEQSIRDFRYDKRAVFLPQRPSHFNWNWKWQAAVAVLLLLLGGIVGRFLFVPQHTEHYSLSPVRETDKKTLMRETAEYLEMSKILLLGFVNIDPTREDLAGLDFSQEQRLSTRLVRQLPALHSRLEASREIQLANLLEDLEVILLQIANLEDAYDLSAIELIQTGVETRGILFKINIEEMRRNLTNPSPKPSGSTI